jgi:hypothetical protein
MPSTHSIKRRIRITACLKRTLAARLNRSRDSITNFDPLGPAFREILSDTAEELTGKRLKNYGPMNADSSFDSAVDFLMTVVQN